MKFRSKYFWIGFSTLVLLSIFLFILKPIDALSAVSKVGWYGLWQIFILVAITQIIRALRFFELLLLRTAVPYYSILQITCIYQFLNHILPVRSGELSLPFLLKRYSNCTYSSSFTFLILTRLHDALALGIIVFFGVLVLTYQGRIASLWLFYLVAIALLIVVLTSSFILWIKISKTRLRRSNKPLTSSFTKLFVLKLKPLIKTLSEEILVYKGTTLHLKLFGYSILLWVVIFGIFWRVLQLVGINVSFSEAILGSSLSNLTQLLPINTIGNLGTLEAGWVFGFSLLGFDSYKTLTAGIVMHVIVIIAAATYGGISWITLIWREKTGLHKRF